MLRESRAGACGFLAFTVRSRFGFPTVAGSRPCIRVHPWFSSSWFRIATGLADTSRGPSAAHVTQERQLAQAAAFGKIKLHIAPSIGGEHHLLRSRPQAGRSQRKGRAAAARYRQHPPVPRRDSAPGNPNRTTPVRQKFVPHHRRASRGIVRRRCNDAADAERCQLQFKRFRAVPEPQPRLIEALHGSGALRSAQVRELQERPGGKIIGVEIAAAVPIRDDHEAFSTLEPTRVGSRQVMRVPAIVGQLHDRAPGNGIAMHDTTVAPDAAGVWPGRNFPAGRAGGNGTRERRHRRNEGRASRPGNDRRR